RADPDGALATIVARYKRVEARCDAVVVLGSDYTDVGSPAELAYNGRIATNLGAPVLLVLGGRQPHGQAESLGSAPPRSPEQMGQIAALAVAELRRQNAGLAATIVNRADSGRTAEIVAAVAAR